MNIVIKWLLVTLNFSTHCLIFIRDASSCSRWSLPQKPAPDNVQRLREFGTLNLKSDAFIKPFPSRFRDLCKRWDRKTRVTRGDGWLQENSICQPQQNCHADGLAETGTACTRPPQVQARQNPSMQRGKWTQSPTSNQETVCNWHMMGEGKAVFPSRTALNASTTLNGRSHAPK